MRDELLAHLATLRIKLAPQRLDEFLAKAEQERWLPVELLRQVLQELARGRAERAIQRRIENALFARPCSLDGFDWSFNAKTIDRRLIENLATADFVHRTENLIIVGQSGVGKSHLVQAIGVNACASGYRVRYTTSAALISKLAASLADGTLPKMLRSFFAPELLIIDEFGFDQVERNHSRQAASLLYKVIDQRHSRRSTALVTNVDFAAWPDYLGDAPLSMAFIDRLLDRAVVIKINGRSYRVERPKA